MAERNSFQITLGGRTYRLVGEESSEYLGRLCTYIEGKYKDFSGNIAFRGKPLDYQHMLLEVNIADDCFKAREELAIMKRKYEEQNAELERLRACLVENQVKIDNLETNAKLLEKKLQDTKGRLNRLQSRNRSGSDSGKSAGN